MRGLQRALALACMSGVLAACGPPDAPRAVPDADAARGRALIQRYGCAACHTIPGIPGATAVVGPPLQGMADRGYIGGILPNTPDAMVQWLQDPQAVTPRTIMPNLDISEEEARHMTGFLYTLRAGSVLSRMVRGFFERASGRRVPPPPPAQPGSTGESGCREDR